MHKILQARIQQYVNQELPDVQARFRKGRGTRDQIAEIHWITEKDHDSDNHDGMIAHLEPEILECEVKWALGSITTNKGSGGDGIPAETISNPKR